MKEYITVKGYSRAEIEIKHSRFIASAKHVESREEAVEFLAKITKEFSDATHNCYAYVSDVLGNEIKFSDNGEPSGTAGQPILDVITKIGLKQIIVVVTRYFGGIKLGAGGLVGAYSSSASKVVKQMPLVRMRPSKKIELAIPYTFAKKCENLPAGYDGQIVEREYSSFVIAVVLLPNEKVDEMRSAFLDLTKGQGEFTVLGDEYRQILL